MSADLVTQYFVNTERNAENGYGPGADVMLLQVGGQLAIYGVYGATWTRVNGWAETYVDWEMTGSWPVSGWVVIPCGCDAHLVGDLDGDGDVDLNDLAIFLNSLTGSR